MRTHSGEGDKLEEGCPELEFAKDLDTQQVQKDNDDDEDGDPLCNRDRVCPVLDNERAGD